MWCACGSQIKIMVFENFNSMYLLWEKSYGVDGSDPAPTKLPKLARWQVKDARVILGILESIDP